MDNYLPNNQESADEENPYWISFSDIMAGILVLFILATIGLMLEVTSRNAKTEQAINDVTKADEIRSELITEIAQDLRSKNIPVQISENHTVIRIPEDVITFEQGKFDLPSDPKTIAIANEVGAVIYETLTRANRFAYLDTISIEGHTDSAPYNNTAIKGNWGLSTFRAIAVWEMWISTPETERLASLVNQDGKPLFSVSGFASTRPDPSTLNDINSPESQSKNRRIDIRFTIRRPALETYDSIKSLLNL